MATVEKTTRVRNVAEASRRVLDPLRRLRGYIRLYVTLEAAAIVLLCIFTCCWLSFAFDYGAFKMPFLHTDWVQVLPWTPVRELWQGLFGGSFFGFITATLANVLRVVPLVALFLLVVVLVAAKAINRLLQRFRDPALALELERRFPKILGDRLITAVELANRRKVAEQGYSAAMVDETIVEAAQRVEKLPLKEVFRWKRLWMMGFLIFFLSVMMYFMMGGVFAFGSYVTEREGPVASFSDYNDILSIWFERNFLVQNTIWPRKAHLVFLEPENADLRIGRDRQPPPIRVRAWEYVVADSHTREGWRLLTWNDLETKPKLLGDGPAAVAPGDWKVRDSRDGLTVDETVLFFRKYDIRKGENPVTEDGVQLYYFPGGTKLPYQWAIADSNTDEGWRPLAWKSWEKVGGDYLTNFTITKLPTGWKPPLTPSLGYTFDEVEAAMADVPAPQFADVRNVLAQIERLNDMRKTLDRLESRVVDPAMRRTMRKLKVPSTVVVNLTGPTTKNTITLEQQGLYTNEYTGTFPELKEKNAKDTWTFDYYAQGEDYTTPTRKLTSVPPPALIDLSREDSRPAYLYYLPGGPSNATTADIKGKKQPLERSKVSVMSGDVVSLDCPAGTDLTLSGETDKPLQSVKFTKPVERQPSVDLVDDKGHKLPAMTMAAAIDSVKKELTEPNLAPARRTYLIGKLAEFVAAGAGHAADMEPEPDVTLDGPTSFHVTLPNVRQDRIYEVEMIDTDNVRGTRKIKIRVIRDNEPSVDLAVADWIRKAKNGYLVTPKARIPFTGNIKDDNGLAKVKYVYTVTKVESTALLDVQALLASGVVGMMAPGGVGGAFHGTTFLAGALREYDKAKNAHAPDTKAIKFYPDKGSIVGFEAQLRAIPDLFLPRADITGLLSKAQATPFRSLLKEFKVEPDRVDFNLQPNGPVVGDFDVTAANLLAEDGKAQVSYRITLWIEATDNDLDSTKGIDGVDGPKTGTSKERFSIFVVPEDELLQKIGEDEAAKSDDLAKGLGNLQDAQEKLNALISDLNDPGLDRVSPLSVRTKNLEGVLDNTQGIAKDVLMKYRGLFKELKANDIQGNKMEIVLKEIIGPLDELDNFDFADGKAKLEDLRKDLDSGGKLPEVRARSLKSSAIAAKQLQELIDRVQNILDKMQKQIEINKALELAREILLREQRAGEILKILYEKQQEYLLNEALKGKEPKP